ncbi:MAG TPA: acetyl-CoA hydrolase/transferase C-terminal domain-containing protein [Saprospiraceae bacterium]|nr:acetyl-CoA hydrolase/transferase C-terminal domain-containing protein [Saprospiraceae bacterium]
MAILRVTPLRMQKYLSAREAVQTVNSGDRIFLHGSAATPHTLIHALAERGSELKNVELISISTLGTMPLADEKFRNVFHFNSVFVSENIRHAVNTGMGSYIPVFLSEIPTLFNRKILPIDVAFVHISPPDRHGYCSLGVSVDVAVAGVKNAKHVIAQVNAKMPRTHGDGIIHVNEINALVESDSDLPEVDYHKGITPIEIEIGKHCASLIEDGSTLQLGIGTIPDAVLAQLQQHKDLGVHTEMFSDGVIDLVKLGVITNKFKKKHQRKILTSFTIGSRALYDFIDDNPLFAFLESSYVNATNVIRQNPKVIAINSAIEVDLTGQICADSIGTYQFSGVGGQMDFMRGASLSEGGKPIIAMASTSSKGDSKIVPFLRQGAGVVTTRAHVHYVITEYGIANLYGKNLDQRAHALTQIAHPDHRENLEKEIRERFGKKIF